MGHTRILASILFWGVTFSHVGGQLIGEFPDEGGPITITTTDGPIQAGGIEFEALTGSLSHGTNPHPWLFFLPDRPGVVTLGSIGTSPTLDGSVTLDVTATAGAKLFSRWGRWGDGLIPTLFPVNGYFPSDAEIVAFGPSPKIELPLEGYFPFVGGPVSLEAQSPVRLVELEITATRGTLQSGGSPFPFQNLNANTQVWSATSTEEITVDGTLTLDLVASADAFLKGEVRNTDGHDSIVMRNVRVSGNGPLLRASYPAQGRYIDITPSGDQPVSLRGLAIKATRGELDSSDNPVPFGELVNNSPNLWYAQSDSDVIIDGPVRLDVGASADARIAVGWTDGNEWHPVSTGRRRALNISASRPFGGGPIEIKNSVADHGIRSIEFTATHGTLIAIDEPSPFESIVANNIDSWVATSDPE